MSDIKALKTELGKHVNADSTLKDIKVTDLKVKDLTSKDIVEGGFTDIYDGKDFSHYSTAYPEVSCSDCEYLGTGFYEDQYGDSYRKCFNNRIIDQLGSPTKIWDGTEKCCCKDFSPRGVEEDQIDKEFTHNRAKYNF